MLRLCSSEHNILMHPSTCCGLWLGVPSAGSLFSGHATVHSSPSSLVRARRPKAESAETTPLQVRQRKRPYNNRGGPTATFGRLIFQYAIFRNNSRSCTSLLAPGRLVGIWFTRPLAVSTMAFTSNGFNLHSVDPRWPKRAAVINTWLTVLNRAGLAGSDARAQRFTTFRLNLALSQGSHPVALITPSIG